MLVGAVAAGPVAAFCFAAQGESSCMQHLPRDLTFASVAGRVLPFLFTCFHKYCTFSFDVLHDISIMYSNTKLACRAGAVVSVQILTIHSVTHVLHVSHLLESI